MPRTARALIPVLLAAALAAHADPLVQPPTAEGVTATETAWLAAIKAHDTATLGRLLAPEFVDTTWQGLRRDRAAALAAASTGGAGDQRLSDLTVDLPKEAHGAAILRGRNTVLGPDGAVRAHIRFTDVFVYRDGGWRAVAAQETLEQGS